MQIRVTGVAFSTRDYPYRAPIKFGGVAVDRATILTAEVAVVGDDGRAARGTSAMPLGNVWAYPSKVMTYDETLAAMTALAERVAAALRDSDISGHPIDIGVSLEPVYLNAAKEIPARDPVPVLATLVTASAFDAATHDAYGNLLGRNCYQTYGRDLLPADLGKHLGPDFAGEHLADHVRREPVDELPLYHLVGALDPLSVGEVTRPVGDGLPEHLGEWIERDGLTHLKIKLNGDDLNWDVERILSVNRVAESSSELTQWHFSLDFNERCPNAEYLIECLRRIQTRSPAAYDRVQYVEQPTHRDLSRGPSVSAAASLKPIVIDESLVGLESLLMARELGYTGVALKACKGQTQSLLMAAAARKLGLFLCVQDLTCPGAAFVHSAGLAAHVPGVAAIEGNARQYVPAASAGWEGRFAGLFRVRGGRIRTAGLTGPGLGQ